MPKASIIIRTKNEEQWVKYCLKIVHAQSFKDFEVILVDNDSKDATVKVAQREGITRVVTIGEYRPGHALNRGIDLSSSDYIVCLSAHCIPQDERWLETLLGGFESEQVAGVYGRQIPVSFSTDYDKRDLLIIFGLDRRVQVKDYFFHNANSAIRRDIWEKIPFDNEATNIEDRIWAKAVISAGYHLVYEPDAVVYHHHGVHQNLDLNRVKSIVSILEKVEPAIHVNSLPETMKPEAAHIAAVCPVLGEIRYHNKDNLLERVVNELNSSRYVNSIYFLSENPEVKAAAIKLGVQFIQRPDCLFPPDKTVEDVLQFAFLEIEERGEFPDAVLYANYLFPRRPTGFFDRLVEELQYKGLDTVFGGLPDYDNYWIETPGEGFGIIGDGMKPRASKRPLYRALYGLGTIAASPQVRRGTLIGKKIGIIIVDDSTYANKVGSSLDFVSHPSA